MMEWISVNDRLPEVFPVEDKYAKYKDSEYVLVFCADNRCAIAQYEVDSAGRTVWARYDGGGEKVTHWMPLPAPPKD